MISNIEQELRKRISFYEKLLISYKKLLQKNFEDIKNKVYIEDLEFKEILTEGRNTSKTCLKKAQEELQLFTQGLNPSFLYDK